MPVLSGYPSRTLAKFAGVDSSGNVGLGGPALTFDTGATTAEFTIQTSDPGATGAVLGLYQNSASPANLDHCGNLRFYGKDSAANKTLYAELNCRITETTNGAESGCLTANTMLDGTNSDTRLGTETFLIGYNTAGGSTNYELIFRGPSGYQTYCYIESFDGGVQGPQLSLWHNSPSPAANDIIGAFTFDGNDSGGNYTTYGRIEMVPTSVTHPSEVAKMIFYTTVAGVLKENLRIDGLSNVIVNNDFIGTTATNGFLYVPSCAGIPTGVPTTYSGRTPVVVDTTNNRLYFYSTGAWRNAGP